MEIVKAWEESGRDVPEPYRRHLKVALAPDKRNIPDLTFSYVYIHPHSGTDRHAHDRPELIIVLTGYGTWHCDGKDYDLRADMALWVEAGEVHQIVNKSDETLRLATVFFPGFTEAELMDPIVDAAGRDA